MKLPNTLKTTGYIVSSLNVVLLGVVSWKAGARDPFTAACLAGGMLASILGMVLRWTSYQLEEDE